MRIVITGSSSGIGRGLAERLLAHGHQVWGLARSDQAEMAVRYAGAFRATCCNVAEWAQVERAAAGVAAAWPGIDALVCCAGQQGEIGRALAADPIRWSATARANLDGTFFPIRAFHPAIRGAARRAKIVCFSGGGATKARPRFSAYGAAKTAIVRLVETIAEEERAVALDINAVAPGPIFTRMTGETIAAGPVAAGDAEYEAALRQQAAGGAPLERALDLVEWLLSPASDGISGRLISAAWDPWRDLGGQADAMRGGELYTLRRVVPQKPA
jgi:NAD(P)-dependent dehydrogenase (short-subunit alcohol dehydrogenase family)